MKIQLMSDLARSFFLGKNKSLPTPPWKAMDVVKMVLLTGLFLLFFSYGILEIAKWYFGEFETMVWIGNPTHLKVLIIVGMMMQIVVELFFLFLYSRWKYKSTLADFGFTPTPIRATIFLALFVFLLIGFGQDFFIQFLEWIPGVIGLDFSFFFISSEGNSVSLETIIQNELVPIWFLFFFAGFLAPITEELVFRGYLLPTMMKKMGYIWGVVVCSAFFAISHLVFEPITLLIMFLLGVMLSVMYIRTGSLWPGIIFHGINNNVGVYLAVTHAQGMI